VPLADALRAIDSLLDEDKLDLLLFSFHSPTLEPGHTFYTRNAEELVDFYRWWDGVLEHLAKRGVAPTSQQEILAALDA
jgi:hypothetical protein